MSATKKTTKKTTKKPVAKKYEYKYVAPKAGSIRFKLLGFYKKHKRIPADAIKAAVKAGINHNTATRQIYLMHANGAK